MTTSSYALRMAHILHKDSDLFTWSQCVSQAWYLLRMIKALREGIVCFSYQKKEDDSLRDARGTLNSVLIPDEDKPKGTGKAKPNFAIIPYYDLDRKAWRCFDIRLFVSRREIYRLERKDIRKSKQKEL